MISVFTARGMLIESQNPTWLYATASEHAVYYQFNFVQTSNLYAGLLQTESPYYQPMPNAPSPYLLQVGEFTGDPWYQCGTSPYDGCDSSWSLIMTGCENVIIAALGAYSWFNDYSQDCSMSLVPYLNP
jgi:hypothetical protein